MINDLSQYVGELVNDMTPNLWRWKNRDVQLVDGTTVTMPDTVNNQRAYPQQRGQKPGLGFPICRIVGITVVWSYRRRDGRRRYDSIGVLERIRRNRWTGVFHLDIVEAGRDT